MQTGLNSINPTLLAKFYKEEAFFLLLEAPIGASQVTNN